jgi:hypothetical protein
MAEINRLAALQGAEINEAKKVLATEATALVHGRAKAEAAAKTAQQTFEQGALAEGLPTVEIPIAEGEGQPSLGVLTAFVKAGLVKSNAEARRLIRDGGLRINDNALSDEAAKLLLAELTTSQGLKLSLGKKRHVLLRVSSSSIDSIRYDAETRMLEVEFKGGRTYRYHSVEEGVFNAFEGAQSKGLFFNEHIRDAYPYVRVK